MEMHDQSNGNTWFASPTASAVYSISCCILPCRKSCNSTMMFTWLLDILTYAVGFGLVIREKAHESCCNHDTSCRKASPRPKLVNWWSKWDFDLQRQQTQGQGHKEFPYSKGLMSHDKPKHGWVVITWWKPGQYTMLPCEIWQAKTGTKWKHF